MTANYHTHTYRCRHASMEDERLYVEAAIAAGYSELGFADHSPMPLPAGVDESECTRSVNIRMAMDETEGYVTKLLALREEYKNDIKIHIGFEVEYFPEVFDEAIEFLNQFPTDYIILGQHFESPRVKTYFGEETRSDKILARYANLVCEGLKTGKFTYLAHPDLCNYRGRLEVYEREMKRIIETAKECNIPLEMNLLGLNAQRHYPNQSFWTMTGDIGARVVLGSDAHETKGIKPDRAIYYAKKVIENTPGLTLLDRVEFMSIK